MPTLSLLKRSGRDNAPWATRTINNDDNDIAQARESAPKTAGTGLTPRKKAEALPPVDDRPSNSSNNSNNSNNSRGGSVADKQATPINDPIPPSFASLSSAAKKERRESKREILHDLISWSIRGAGRALTTSTPPSPPASQLPSSTSSASPASTLNTASAAASSTSQGIVRSRQRRASATAAFSATWAGGKTVRFCFNHFLFKTCYFSHFPNERSRFPACQTLLPQGKKKNSLCCR